MARGFRLQKPGVIGKNKDYSMSRKLCLSAFTYTWIIWQKYGFFILFVREHSCQRKLELKGACQRKLKTKREGKKAMSKKAKL